MNNTEIESQETVRIMAALTLMENLCLFLSLCAPCFFWFGFTVSVVTTVIFPPFLFSSLAMLNMTVNPSADAGSFTSHSPNFGSGCPLLYCKTWNNNKLFINQIKTKTQKWDNDDILSGFCFFFHKLFLFNIYNEN